MRANRRQNGSLDACPRGRARGRAGIAFFALVLPVAAGHPAPDSHTGSPGSSVTGTRTAAPQPALHTVTTTAPGIAFRLGEPGGCPPVSGQPIDPPNRPAWRARPPWSRPSLPVRPCASSSAPG